MVLLIDWINCYTSHSKIVILFKNFPNLVYGCSQGHVYFNSEYLIFFPFLSFLKHLLLALFLILTGLNGKKIDLQLRIELKLSCVQYKFMCIVVFFICRRGLWVSGVRTWSCRARSESPQTPVKLGICGWHILWRSRISTKSLWLSPVKKSVSTAVRVFIFVQFISIICMKYSSGISL